MIGFKNKAHKPKIRFFATKLPDVARKLPVPTLLSGVDLYSHDSVQFIFGHMLVYQYERTSQDNKWHDAHLRFTGTLSTLLSLS